MKHLRIVLCVSLLALLAACGPSNNVRLLPPPPLDASVLPSPNAPRVTVVTFEDKRMDQSVIGTRRDNSAFVTTDNVSQWISKALADELARNGMQVSYSISVNEARKGNPDFLVTGQIDEANIRETSTTDMATSLRANYVLANRQARIMRESLNASQSRTGLPSGSAADNLMLETLRDLVKPMAQKIVQTIEAKK
ncbi:hypothetical protein DDIC_00690 [Desulfovibrio desulfuricans]|uniref:Lipoprotein n=1 Tax=Desulfovibrio desulfuricans TaxID=876 RepID=A0A4P7UGG2_DESDE|nr:hypothetical protein [Desulfovibrio desulfuricans]QCC84417.1 hypothetical protein DDIC_00690 [Desulfovibrio desulfuricans]